ncbi:type IV toxin-antitoxin system AbiEi family antitoxin domain-containing protein [Arachidicoccus terrestris]|uniref:type IV toxin-antitoxin system AbiEi family antitoxin domain-containing protein n=1 Tax=Arachidicoccus terrestris TaxID=2875539 RepID=UPI001CC494FC|nr:type IV toxin-antitoxin system AbiEi family antitoxin [Arachidicoccus terrestris]UAY55718.1 hypothetical protein K9M52_01405 [Arachidicoccus terrestris]
MANKSRFVIAENTIKAFFKNGEKKIFSRKELGEVLEQNRSLWKLPITMNRDQFIDRLLENNILSRTVIEFNSNIRKEKFLEGEPSTLQIASSLINRSYLSHFTAVFLHGLTTQVPKTVYISFEQSEKVFDRNLTQTAIDSAFSKPQRRSGVTATYKDYTFLLHNGMYTNRTGVFVSEGLPITNIERTLIDIAVRPAYAGGVDSVLEVYKKAISRISINKLVATLDKLNFIYPYHQAIGFYLERAGLIEKKLEPLKEKEKNFDFYLTYAMMEKEYDETWRIYYPKGM